MDVFNTLSSSYINFYVPGYFQDTDEFYVGEGNNRIHIAFAPKYRRKEFYDGRRAEIGKNFKRTGTMSRFIHENNLLYIQF